MTYNLRKRQSLTVQRLNQIRSLASIAPQPNLLDSDISEAILDELGIEFRELAISTDFAVPDGMNAFLAYRGDRVILEVYPWKGGYVCRRNNGRVYDDPYGAIVGGYEHYNPGAVLLVRLALERDREIEAVRRDRTPEYA
jgi:hypothetical protein